MALSRIDIKYFKMAVGTERLGKETDHDIAARCPVCGDSHISKNKKRLHLYSKNGVTNVNCFNGDCPAQNRSVYSFLRDFFPSLIDHYKRENFTHTMEKLSESDNVFQNLSASKKPKPTNENPVVTHDLTPYLKDISEVPEALEYLEGRGIHYDPEKFGKWYFGTQNLQIGETFYRIAGAIVIPMYYGDKMYGFYSRSIKDKIFYTYNPEANIGYKLWNWFNVDKTKPVYIYEAIFDAISGGLDNSIALLGAKMPQDRLEELDQPVFVLDNDRTGKMNAIHYAEQGHQVYVQPDGYEKDMNANLQNGVNTRDLILNNIYSSISAITRIKFTL